MKITKQRLKQIIKEELETVMNENFGRQVIALYPIERPEPKIPNASVGDLVILNKEYTGRDGKKYGKYAVYFKGQKVRYKDDNGQEKVVTIPDLPPDPKRTLNGGYGGESHVAEIEDLNQAAPRATWAS